MSLHKTQITFQTIVCLLFFLIVIGGERNFNILEKALEKVVHISDNELHCAEIILCANNFSKSQDLFTHKRYEHLSAAFMEPFIMEINEKVEKVVVDQKNCFVYYPEEIEDSNSIFTKLRIFRMHAKWKSYLFLVWPISLKNELEIEEILLKISIQDFIHVNTDVYFVFSLADEIFSFWEIYWLKNQRIFRNITDIESIGNKIDRRGDFMGVSFIATTVNDSSYKHWVNVGVGETGEIQLKGGFSVKIYADFKKMMNFTETVVLGDWLSSYQNGSLAGTTVSQLNKGQADLSIVQASIIEFRAKELSFLQPTYQSIIKAFFTQPDSALQNVISAPFQTTLWIALFFTWVLTIFSINIFLFIKARFQQNDREDDDKFAKEATMWAIAATCQKSWYTIPSSFSMKSVFLIGYICGLVTFVAYSAAIVSSLATITFPIQAFADLLRFRFIFTVHENSGSMKAFLKELIRSFTLGQKEETTTTMKEIEHFIKEPKAFLSFPDSFYSTAFQLNYSETFLCRNVYVLTVNPVPVGSGMFMKKGSPYAEMFSHKIMMLKERGLNRRYQQDYDNINGVTCSSDRRATQLDPVETDDVFTAYIIIFTGLALSCILLIIETLVWHLYTLRSLKNIHLIYFTIV